MGLVPRLDSSLKNCRAQQEGKGQAGGGGGQQVVCLEEGGDWGTLHVLLLPGWTHHAREVGDARLRVVQADGNLADLALDLDHAVEDDVRQDHEGILADERVVVAQARVQEPRVGLHEVGEPKGQVTQRRRDAGAQLRRPGVGEDREQQRQRRFAEGRRHAHELAERQQCRLWQ